VTSETTDDGFLNGRLQMLQPRQGYRAATDPVFLAAAVDAKSGESVLELGCGVGVALACLLARVNLMATGVEIQPAYAELAQQNMARNDLDAQIFTADIADMPPTLRAQSFDHVMMNPPFFPIAKHSAPQNVAKSRAFIEGETSLNEWIIYGLKRLKPLGWLTIIHRAERLADILAGLEKTGDVRILPLAPRIEQPAGRVIVQARKGAAGPLKLLSPLVLHTGVSHGQDGDDFSPAARAILRDGRSLAMSCR